MASEFWTNFGNGLEGFISAIPVIGGITKGISAGKEAEKSDRIAGLEAINAEKAAKNAYTTAMANKNQALMDAEMNTSLAAEAAARAAQTTEQGAQAAEQIRAAGNQTLGSQGAMLAATGQAGAGSAVGLQKSTKANISGDVDTTLANAASEAAIYDEKASGYTTLSTTLAAQAALYGEQAADFENDEGEFDEGAAEDAYLAAYWG